MRAGLIRDAVAAVITAAIVLAVAAKIVLGHEAPAGWRYDYWCCSQRDCGQVDDGAVTFDPETGGWIVRALNLWTGEYVVERVPDMDRRSPPFRRLESDDPHFHVCWQNPAYRHAAQVRCLYVPHFGF